MQDDKRIQDAGGGLVPAQPSRVQIVEHGMTLHVHRVTDDQLDEFISGYGSLNFGFFALCIGLLTGFGITAWTVDLSDRKFAAFVAVVAVSAIGVVYFGFQALLERKRLKALSTRLRGG